MIGRYDAQFVEERRKGLEEFINSVVNHPFSRFEKALQDFLQDQDFKVSFLQYKYIFISSYCYCYCCLVLSLVVD